MSNTGNASLACKRVDSGTGVEPVRRTRTYVPAVDIVERSDAVSYTHLTLPTIYSV